MDQRGIAAEEVNADGGGGLIYCLRYLGRIAARTFGDQRDWSDRDALIGNADTKLVANLIDRLDQARGYAFDLSARSLGHLRHRVAGAIEQTESERDGAHIEMFHLRHRYGLENFCLG